MSEGEMVLGFYREKVFGELSKFQGINTDNVDEYMSLICSEGIGVYLPREEAEERPDFKQVIPYILFTHGNKIFSYRRGKGGGESRLHKKLSIGIGGHINENDKLASPIPFDYFGLMNAVSREINEEVVIRQNHPLDLRLFAMLNDDNDEVGKVHFGLVFLCELASAQISKREDEIESGKMITVESARQNITLYEGWSQICLANLDLEE